VIFSTREKNAFLQQPKNRQTITDAVPSDESETTITITPNGGTSVEILTTSKLVSNLTASRTEYHDTPPSKSKKESK
jgi:hypothetical protein